MNTNTTSPPMILIVDDFPLNIQLVASFLEPEGYRLAVAQDGKEALVQVENHPIDLILLDVMMPDMDGFEVCAHLKASPETSHIPIIFLTAKVEVDDIVRGFEMGAVDYVTKPFNDQELLARVKTHLELKQAKEHIQTLYNQIDPEMDVASEIQKSIMRAKASVPFVEFSLILEPFGRVSGDLVDFSVANENELRFLLGDATGHGIPAALITMMIPLLLDGRKERGKTNEVIAHLNTALTQRNLEGNFITGIYAQINKDGFLTFCSAGHYPLLIAPANNESLISLNTQGMAMGMFSDDQIVPYEECEYQLQPGDKIFLYTDGILEWQNSEHEQFGKQRLEQCLDEYRKNKVEIILQELMKQIHDFSHGIPCNDDYTIIGFEYIGSQ